MCRGGKDGQVRRCKRGSHGKAHESFQKALYYQAKINGTTIDEWVTTNPESFQTLVERRDAKLLAANPEQDTATLNYLELNDHRAYTGILDLEAYKEDKANYCNSLNLTEKQETALRFYGNDMFNPLNKYFLEKSEDDIFSRHAKDWEKTGDGYQTFFSDEENLMDFASELDECLSHRTEEKRTLYRGMNMHANSSHWVDENGEKFTIKDLGEQQEFLTKAYTPGTEIVFDAYSSTSDYVGVGAEWSGIDYVPYEGQKETVGILYELKTNAGLPIAHISDNDDEREVLLPRGMKFKVVQSYWNDDNAYSFDSIEENDDLEMEPVHSESTNERTLIVQLVEVDDDGEEVNTTERYEAPALVPRAFR